MYDFVKGPNSSTMSCSVNAAAVEDGTFVKHRLQFADSLKDLRSLRKQLYSAAEYFESSYNTDNHKQFMVESSKDYVAKALVNTVDHLGSVADKLNKFLDQKANECSKTNTQFSCIEQRLCTVEGFVQSRGLSQHLLQTKDIGNHKLNIVPSAEKLAEGRSKVVCENRLSSLQPNQENSSSKSFQAPRTKQYPPLTRKQESREASPNPPSFSFTNKITNKEAGKRSVSPLALPLSLKLASKRSVSPNPSLSKGQRPPPRRAISASRRREITNTEMEMESYTKKSKHLLKALLSLHHSRKLALHKQIQG